MSEERTLKLKSGGWLLLAGAGLALVVMVWIVLPALRAQRVVDAASGGLADYGFDFEGSLVPLGRIVASGTHREEIRSLESPPLMSVADVETFNENHRGKYLVTDDRVIGVVIGAQARAYPLRMLNWHEIVNDELGGVPIAVTFNPLCDSVAVFERRVNGEVLEFGVSGLLLNSNLLLFDRREDDGESSLWSQLQARAVTGPAAGSRLEVLPSSLTRWGKWRERHPDTDVPRPAEDHLKRYQRNPYGPYLVTGRPRFPVEPLPPESGPLSLMSPVVIVNSGDRRTVYPIDPAASVRTRLDGLELEIDGSEPASSLVEAGPDVGVVYSLWFAWYASHPDTALQELEPLPAG